MNADATKWLLEEVTGPVLRLAARSDPDVVDLLVATAAEVRMIAPENVVNSERDVFEEWDLPSHVEEMDSVEDALMGDELFGALFVSGLPAATSEAPRLLDRALARLGDKAPVRIEIARSTVRVDRVRGLLEGTCSEVSSTDLEDGWVLTGRRRAPGRDVLVSLEAIEGLAAVVVATADARAGLEETLASVLFHVNPMPEVVLVLDDAGEVSEDLFGMAAHASAPVALMRTEGAGFLPALAHGLEALDQECVAIVQPGWRLAAGAFRALAAGWREDEDASACLAGEFSESDEFSGVLLAARANFSTALSRTVDWGVFPDALSEAGDLISLPFPVLVGPGNESILR